jgi:NAD+ synthase (glutamine-hydrolysing)
MKIALAQLNYHIGNFESNTQKIIEHIRLARSKEAQIIVFAELALTGYPPRDFLEFNAFLDRSEQAIESIAEASIGITVIVGAPIRNENPFGKPLFNAAVVIQDGKVHSIHHKWLLPNYDVFDEYRYFEPGKETQIVELHGKRVAIAVCEDLWNLTDQPMYGGCPMDYLSKENPDLLINIAASPFDRNHHEDRLKILRNNVENYKIPLVYVNHVGAQTELIFDGGSMVLDDRGNLVAQLKFFEEDFKIIDLAEELRQIPDKAPVEQKRVHDALVLGIKDFFTKLTIPNAWIGLSGGIDSALTTALAVDALGKEHVTGVLMPSEFSSDHSITDAVTLAEKLGIHTFTLPIHDPFKVFNALLSDPFEKTDFDITEENIQARIRGVLLMALSNKKGGIVLNTSNKSEAAVGYGTLYGDMVGGLSVLGDLYKTEVFDLAKYINRQNEVIPWNSINKPPSAELREDQKDSDSLPTYDQLDPILHLYIEKRKGPQEIIEAGFDEALVYRIIRLVNLNEYKRLQAPPVLRISTKAFGMGRRMPIVAKYLI